VTHEVTRDRVEYERYYRRELRITRFLIAILLVVSLAVPPLAGAAVAALATAYAFIYRRYVGLRWVLLPAFFVLFSLAGVVTAATLNRPEVVTIVRP
jgi:cell division protein FtsW (lipid II flippase)